MCLWQKYIKKCLKFRLLCHFAFFRVLYKPWHAINTLHMNPQRSCIYTKGFIWNQSFIVMRFLESPRVLFGVSKGPWAKRMCIPLQFFFWKFNTLSYLNQTLHTTPQDLVLEPSCVSEVKKVTQSLKMWSVQRCWYTAVTKYFFPASVALTELSCFMTVDCFKKYYRVSAFHWYQPCACRPNYVGMVTSPIRAVPFWSKLLILAARQVVKQ